MSTRLLHQPRGANELQELSRRVRHQQGDGEPKHQHGRLRVHGVRRGRLRPRLRRHGLQRGVDELVHRVFQRVHRAAHRRRVQRRHVVGRHDVHGPPNVCRTPPIVAWGCCAFFWRSSCVACGTGMLIVALLLCVRFYNQACNPGMYDHDNDATTPCRPCQHQKWQPNTAATSCPWCPDGHTSHTTNTYSSTTLTTCGKSWPGCVGARSCIDCPEGKWDHDGNPETDCKGT